MPILAASARAQPDQRLSSVAESSVVVPAMEVSISNGAREMQDPVDANYSNIMHKSSSAGGAATAVDDFGSNHHDPALHSKGPEYGSNHTAPSPERMQEHSSAGKEAGAQEGSEHPQHLSALHSDGRPDPQSSHAVIDPQATRDQAPAGQQQEEAFPEELQQGKASVQDPAKSAASLPGSVSAQDQTEHAAASEESNDAFSPAKSSVNQPDSSEPAKQPELPPDLSHVDSTPGALQTQSS